MAESNSIVFAIFAIFAGAAILSTVALFTRQSLLVAYIILGAILGPWGLKLVIDPEFVMQISEIGITFLLFLLGLNLHPQDLIGMLKNITVVSIVSSILFAAIGFFVGYYFGFTIQESIILGIAIMFSSTIIGLKLLPTTKLHHQHIGEVIISILLMQDLIAIIALLVIHGLKDEFSLMDGFKVIGGLPGLILFAYIVEKYILVKLISKFDKIKEYIFLIAVGWCLGVSQLSDYLGLSPEIGAFIAGVTLATSPIALYIAESLKPLRDFFLVMFFFAIGAGFDFSYLKVVIIPAAILASLMLLLKPICYYFLLRKVGESSCVAKEVGWRLGQASEFSLLVASIALGHSLISEKANYLIEAATIITFIISSYIIVIRYPTPLGLTEKMCQD